MSPEESSETQSGSKRGILDSVKKLAATLLAMGQTRLELLSTEYEEERERLSSILVWALIALFFTAVAVILATLLIVLYYWDTYRMTAISILLGVFILAAGYSLRIVCNMSKSKPRLFSATLAELSKDHEQLTSRHEQ